MRSKFNDGTFSLGGNLYHVEVPEDSSLLDWDKPLSEQPEAVKKALDNVKAELESKGVLDAYLDHANADWEDLTGKELYRLLKKASMDDAISENGPGVGSAMQRGKDDEAVSKYLHNEGLNGIKYLDGSSRSKGEGNYNYVVFDDNAVKIIDRYSARKNQAEGYYHNGRITLFADNIRATGSMSAEERLKWVAFHEITHRGVANLAESQAYLSELLS